MRFLFTVIVAGAGLFFGTAVAHAESSNDDPIIESRGREQPLAWVERGFVAPAGTLSWGTEAFASDSLKLGDLWAAYSVLDVLSFEVAFGLGSYRQQEVSAVLAASAALGFRWGPLIVGNKTSVQASVQTAVSSDLTLGVVLGSAVRCEVGGGLTKASELFGSVSAGCDVQLNDRTAVGAHGATDANKAVGASASVAYSIPTARGAPMVDLLASFHLTDLGMYQHNSPFSGVAVELGAAFHLYD